MKRKPLNFIVIIGAIAFSLVVFFTQFYGVKKVNVSELKMDNAQLPKNLECDWYKVGDIKWEYLNRNNEEYLYLGATEADRKVFQWIDDANGGVVNVAIVNYEYPIVAKLYYYLQDPKSIYGDSYENFINSTPVDMSNWKWDNKFADDKSVQCGFGDQELCNGWFYRARYSQYFLYIRYQGPDCIESFEAITKSINEQFVEFLR